VRQVCVPVPVFTPAGTCVHVWGFFARQAAYAAADELVATLHAATTAGKAGEAWAVSPPLLRSLLRTTHRVPELRSVTIAVWSLLLAQV
jgi:hypothetical protein